MRTHLNWTQASAIPAPLVVAHLQNAWRGRVDFQGLPLIPLDFFADAATGDLIGPAVHALGAFIYSNADLQAKLQRMFTRARKCGLSLDIYEAQSLDVDATGLQTIAQLTLNCSLHGWVVCGHVCSLSAQAGIHIVARPIPDLYLQCA